MESFRSMTLWQGAHTLVNVNANVQPGESVLVVADTEMVEIAEVLATAVVAAGAELTVTIMTPRASHGEDPPPPVQAAMQAAEVIFAPTTVSLFHSKARRQATARGARFCNMVDYRPWMLKEGGLQADFLGLVPLVERLGGKLGRAHVARVTAPAGTDIEMSIEGREGSPQSGLARTAGQVASPPDIEAAVGPVEGTAEGIVVVDGSIPHHLIGLITEPVRLVIEDGMVIQVLGGQQASVLSQLWSGYDDESVYNVAELGLGLNPKARLCGAMLEDEGVYGTVHFGFGDNRSLGGNVDSPLHLDAVIRQPTVYLDGEIILKDGKVIGQQLSIEEPRDAALQESGSVRGACQPDKPGNRQLWHTNSRAGG